MMKRISYLILVALFLVSYSSCKKKTVIPLPPTSLTATAVSTSQINLAWTDNSTNETGFKLERKTGTGSYAVVATASSNVTYFSDNGLVSNTTYTYRVYAYNTAGNSLAYSNEASAITNGVPILSTTAVSSITASSAVSGGTISSDGGTPILAKGIVWSVSPNPTVTLTTKTADGTGAGNFISNISGLNANTVYYVRAYATNATGTGYGNELTFTTNTIDLSTGLVAYYPFTGNGNDSSGNGNNGTVNGATLATDRFGKPNSAYSFNGISDYIKCINAGPTGNPIITVCFWIKTNSVNPGHIIGWGNNGVSGNDFRIIVNGNCTNAISFDTYNSAINYSTPIASNQWDFYVLIYNGGLGSNVYSATIYKNGGLLSNTCFTQNLSPTNITAQFPITFGRYHGNVQSVFFNGSLDDIRIWNRVLTQTQIEYLYTH